MHTEQEIRVWRQKGAFQPHPQESALPKNQIFKRKSFIIIKPSNAYSKSVLKNFARDGGGGNKFFYHKQSITYHTHKFVTTTCITANRAKLSCARMIN